MPTLARDHAAALDDRVHAAQRLPQRRHLPPSTDASFDGLRELTPPQTSGGAPRAPTCARAAQNKNRAESSAVATRSMHQKRKLVSPSSGAHYSPQTAAASTACQRRARQEGGHPWASASERVWPRRPANQHAPPLDPLLNDGVDYDGSRRYEREMKLRGVGARTGWP